MRIGATAIAVVLGIALIACGAPASAVEPPQVVVGAAPPDETPGPEIPTKQDKGCLAAGVLKDSDLSRVPPPELMLDLPRARALSRGAGVSVAVIDTGVTPSSRLPGLVGGGDYVAAGGDGLSDCDAHGTLVAGIISAASDPTDAFVGVAPDARIISIRFRSGAFNLDNPGKDAPDQTVLDLRALSRAIVHAANLGAEVITVSVPICIKVGSPIDQSIISAAIGYAVHVRGALIVAGAGNTTATGCEQNPDIDLTRPGDPRNWRDVKTVSVPGWFGSDVLTVGFTTATGTVMSDSLTGPWVSVGAPGTAIESLGPGGSGLINGVGEPGKLVPVGGSSFAAAYASGVAALLRSRFPNETPAEIMARLTASAHAPARGIDNIVGAGLIDPVAALSYRTPPRPPTGLYRASALPIPDPPRAKDIRPMATAAAVILGAIVLGLGVGYASSAGRRRR
ncbi:type VII secretion-associated serine protease mycosin [Nocardia vinacea]|uniref:Type VII secretion-associated serine protease mycosin n=1 Tax=Nocardia vinacea TaxID=96468 RepID=A0ABZ1Z120_9NOCA|nr:type VII secretion-associated serine protease mycosin [Nocardia vinacea]